ncbi:extracellular solute-binding protein [Haliangium sp.]|uniref:extracellular solute-binding protein n=1 Tax=Haliangium sp. TaxID=2663208 RepID=UPI003D115357
MHGTPTALPRRRRRARPGSASGQTAWGRLSAFALSAALAVGAGCSRQPEETATGIRLRLWHTFNPAETEALNQALREWQGPTVESSMAPFGLGLRLLRNTLKEAKECPDLVRVDATWVPVLVHEQRLLPVPAAGAGAHEFLPETEVLARVGDTRYGLPQALDGLAILYREDVFAGMDWPPETMDELVTTARGLTRDGTYGLGLRVDGYWFVPFLRAWGPGLLVEQEPGAAVRLGVEDPAATVVLERFAALFGADGITPPPSPPDEVNSDEIRRFRAKSLVAVVNGPWAVAELTGGDTTGIGVAPLPEAPRGGHVWAVPACARHPEQGWALAAFLTEPARQAEWADRLGVIPTTRAGLERAGGFVRRFYQALTKARPLPRHPITPELFDDLSPAVAAVVNGDAAPTEALAGVGRAWRRLFGQRELEVAAPAPAAPPPDEGPPP